TPRSPRLPSTTLFRSEVFTASADVRGDRDLPVLIVSGQDLAVAVADLTADLADAMIAAELADGQHGGLAGGPRTDPANGPPDDRSEEHTSELQSRGHL